MTEKEWEKVFEMSQDKNLYHNLCSSLFPTIHGRSSKAASLPATARKALVKGSDASASVQEMTR